MVDPILTSVATTLATKAAGALYDLVSKAFRRRPAAQRALEAAQGAAPDSAPVRALAERLAEVTTEDPDFDRELRATWEDVRTEVSADHGGVANQITGTVTGKVVQAGTINGGVSF
jgi:hypothetical protein